jgi:rod shape-determining protein MreD
MSRSVRALGPFGGAPPALILDPPAWWKVALALVIALLVQTTIAPHLAIRGATPSLVLLLVLWYGLRTSFPAGLLFGTIAGALEDALAGWTGAAWTISSAIVGALAGRTAGTVLTESRLWLVPYVALATVVRYGIYAVVLRAEGHVVALPATHAHALFWQALLNGLIAYLVLTFVPKSVVSRVGLR